MLYQLPVVRSSKERRRKLQRLDVQYVQKDRQSPARSTRMQNAREGLIVGISRT